ncbi:tRNA (adenosine(37)-N6)-threonylcarbamoyltransferase complex ATPase subunit type 1 TsaE [Algoriphagus sp. CAU 1675]|uniref:tRNA (adenosine(37)-N6)-threonylcarbamoyltransferase complex ATPase subunit type 1 TsaE n=1 Tax=Algoriphagus sp. CAU 1675 TaxID=3032597 RepID=UPI0023DB51C6|nr:tRNA (adenosine(37)-N6)-threonylcarbamoyltransferase complex ATPase subunit type 1 TsaE [Algoriphagus sp. CAU 1675]MDF2158615.1 tRNA (adenosine(37)-N6)-threonylcarbamoyltransferase complex ATPase subunit type 1 TsaE [Algoriphagus sp. CAU 1675]
MKSFTYRLDELPRLAAQVIEEGGSEKIWVFQGQMGAGKTTLIKALADHFQVVDQVSSPTFGIVNHYETQKGETIYHFDFYRLEDPSEALDIGIEEYFYSGNYCWMEWAENIGTLLPDQFFLIKIEVIADQERKVTLQHIQNAH